MLNSSTYIETESWLDNLSKTKLFWCLLTLEDISSVSLIFRVQLEAGRDLYVTHYLRSFPKI